jgi:Jacalin-like lectin domain
MAILFSGTSSNVSKHFSIRIKDSLALIRRNMIMRRCLLIAILLLSSVVGETAWGQECIGPAGGTGGNNFYDGGASSGNQITIRSGSEIDSVQFGDNQVHGGTGGDPHTFVLQPGEIVTGIEGRYGLRVDSLRIITNQRTSDQFGGNGGDRDYHLDVPNGETVVGFCGRSGSRMDAIGLSVR